MAIFFTFLRIYNLFDQFVQKLKPKTVSNYMNFSFEIRGSVKAQYLLWDAMERNESKEN